MSLNGLDDAKVVEAYQGALAEGGGWFLLKYASRDAVEVLARGTGGASEIRGAVAQYEETSPLYGFLSYRRRKVLIKYVPEGTSRLLQARVAVHFTTVSEQFTPHDSVFSITTADELSDSALAAACSLHTAAPSNCSSSSSSRRKLDEITEDAEEGSGPSVESQSMSRPTTAASSKDTVTGISLTNTKSSAAPSELPPLTTTLSRSSTAEVPRSAVSHTTIESVPEHANPEFKASSYRDSLKEYDSLFEHGPDPRFSSQTARPAMADIYAEIYAQYKPKVKLGPRPRPSLDSKRPHTSGSGTQNVARPVSSLPAGMRVANRKSNVEPKRPKSRDSSVVPSIAFPPPPPIPPVPEFPLPPTSPGFPPKSPMSVRSLPVHSHSSHRDRATPEKQRLMKALELRKKQMKARQEKAAKDNEAISETKSENIEKEKVSNGGLEGGNVGDTIGDEKPADPPTTPPLQTNPDGPTDTETVTTSGEPAEPHLTSSPREPADISAEELPQANTESTTQPTPGPEPQLDEPSTEPFDAASSMEPKEDRPLTVIQRKEGAPIATPEPSIAADDSALDTTAGHLESDDLQSAASACSPTSAQTQGSSAAPSTRPSSVSEDEKTPEPDEKKTLSLEIPTQQTGESVELLQQAEKESVESSPTIVPESSTSIPSFEVTVQQDASPIPTIQTSASDDVFTRRSKRESMVLMPPGELGRRSKRESAIFMPMGSHPQQDDVDQIREKRASRLFNTTKRHSFVEGGVNGLTTPHISADNSEAEYLSDDSFMEELRSATVEEAKPISVSKSPITPVFPRKSSISGMSERSVSQPYRTGGMPADQAMPRKSSGPWLPHSNSDTAVVAKKINVSSGISQRIKALAEKSNRDSVASVSSLATPESASILQRKSSFFATPPSGLSPESQSVKRLNRTSFINVPYAPSSDRQSVLQPPPSRDGSPTYSPQHGVRKPETVQVTARIIRDGRATRPTLTMPDESTPLELQQSQITIDHQRLPSPRPLSPSKAKVEPTSPRPPSSSHSKDPAPAPAPTTVPTPTSALPRSSSESSWRSFGRRLSESKSDVKTPRSLSAHSLDSTEEKREEKKEKKDSRTSKLFKRMSSISSISRKNSNVSSVPEDLLSTQLPSLREPPPSVQVGDLNVQFPDTLLWKRRWVEIDASGNLVLSLSKSNEQSKGITKRFHLTEFRPPYAPDQDRQELPNSVVLDFNDGRTLQCACETYMAQAQVLQILREAHDAWLAYSQGA